MAKNDLTKGFHLCDIGKKKINKEEFVEEIKAKDAKIAEEVINVLSNKGEVCGFKKDKKLKAIYLFEREKEEKKVILKLSKKIMVDEISEEMEKELDDVLLTNFIEVVALEEISKVVFEDKEIVPKTVKVGKFNIAIGSLSLAIGTIIGVLFLGDDWYIGVMLGISIGAMFGAIISSPSETTIKKK